MRTKNGSIGKDPGELICANVADPSSAVLMMARMPISQRSFRRRSLVGISTPSSDRYGPPPEEVGILVDIMIVKSLGRRLRATAIELSESRLALALSNETPLGPEQVMKLVQMKSSPWRLSPDMRLMRNYQGNEKADRLTVAKKLLHDLLGQAVRA